MLSHSRSGLDLMLLFRFCGLVCIVFARALSRCDLCVAVCVRYVCMVRVCMWKVCACVSVCLSQLIDLFVSLVIFVFAAAFLVVVVVV